jgi:hypothetical protein
MIALADESDVLVQLCFFAPLAFLIVYTVRTPWWHTVHGRTLAALAGVFVLVLLRGVLFAWHVLRPDSEMNPDWLSWFSLNALLLAPIAFFTLTWQLLRKPVRRWVRWVRRGGGSDPLTSDALAQRLRDYGPEHTDQV